MANKKYVSLSKLQTFLDNLKNIFASKTHTHTTTDLTDYTVDTTLSSASANPVQNKVLHAEFEAVSQAMNALDSAIDGKADTSHSHAISDVTDLQTTIDALGESIAGKAPASHEHSAYKITSGILSTEYGGTGNTWGYVQAGSQEGSSIGALATAEGRETIASGSYSHAEGNYTEATGLCAHSEGQTTKASGSMSHAQGESTEAKGKRSHAEGDHTIAAGDASHVQGKYNIEDEEGVYAHIVGNGDWKTPSNAHTLDWDGNGWFAGNVYVGGTSQDDASASRVITKADQRWSLLYDSGEISAIANSISNIDVSGYTNIQVLVRIYNDGDSIGSRNGSAIFKAQNGKSYQFPVWSNMFSKSINTVYTMATFNLVDGWLICPYASRLIGDANTFEDTEGGTAGSLVPTGSGMMKCTSPLSTLTISSLDQNSNYYFGMGSRVMVWGWNA